LLQINQKAEELLDLVGRQKIGLEINSLLPVSSPWLNVILFQQNELVFHAEDGQDTYFEIKFTPLSAQKRSPNNLILIRDVTEYRNSKMAEQSMREMAEIRAMELDVLRKVAEKLNQSVELNDVMTGGLGTIVSLIGEQALAFARDRQSSDDFFRMQRGQMVLKAAVKQMLNPLTWPRIPQIISTGLQAVDTNIPFFEIPRIGLALVRAIISDTINSQTITREMVYPTITTDGANILLPNWEMINPLLMEMFGE